MKIDPCRRMATCGKCGTEYFKDTGHSCPKPSK